MPKSKSTTRTDRTKRAPRDPSPERKEQSLSDGTIDAELDEVDTDKYQPPPRKEH